MGLSQVPVEFEHSLVDTSARDIQVEFCLVSAFGDVLHTLRQEVRSVGILADAQENAAHVEADTIASVLSASDLLEENNKRIEEKGSSKGLFSWFKRS
jgi:hypothetical protein